jgi:hypothetical protein
LRENGVEDSEISRSAPDIVDSQGEYYGNESRPFRYVATMVTTVASKNVDHIRAVMEKRENCSSRVWHLTAAITVIAKLQL